MYQSAPLSDGFGSSLGTLSPLDDYGCGGEVMQSLYAAMRQFGTPGATRISQGMTSEVAPVQFFPPGGGPSTLEFSSYQPAAAVLDGRHIQYAAADAMRTDGGLVPSALSGYVAAPPRAEQWLQTVSEGLVTPRTGEIINTRRLYASAGPGTFSMNLEPMSASAHGRLERAERLKHMHAQLVRDKLMQAGFTLDPTSPAAATGSGSGSGSALGATSRPLQGRGSGFAGAVLSGPQGYGHF